MNKASPSGFYPRVVGPGSHLRVLGPTIPVCFLIDSQSLRRKLRINPVISMTRKQSNLLMCKHAEKGGVNQIY